MLLQSILAAALLITAPQNGPRVRASVSPYTLSAGETVMFSVTVENVTDDVDIGNPRVPRGLDIIGTQDYTEMSYSIPGGRNLTRRREFALMASQPGRLAIPGVVVRVGNRSYTTNAVVVIVTDAAQPRSLPTSSDVFVRATMRPETVYVGQQSTLNVEAGYSDEVRARLTRPPVYDTPSPTGFWVQDVPGGVTSRVQMINGRVIETQSLQRAYFPLSAGKFGLAPARAILDVREGFLFAPETREIRSQSPRLVVLPLPEADKPAGFKGAVGSYAVRARLEPDTVAAGEASQLIVEVIGAGNIKAAPIPVVPSITGVEQFTPTEDADVTFDGAKVTGTKSFKWVIIPANAGRVEIPAISYSFFDPVAKAYRTVATSPVTLVVRPGAAGVDSSTSALALRAARERPQPASLQWVRTRAFLLAQLLPLLLVLGIVLARKLKKSRSNAAVMTEELDRLRMMNPPFPQFLRDLENVVRTAAVMRTNDASLRTAEVRTVRERLRNAGASDELTTRVTNLIERIETQRFAPSQKETEERESLMKEAHDVIAQLTSKSAK
ncbi:MAG TPA: BatD family protein [Longimicrobiales bacterium]|nr:BatD family protein [Longimicrobiales bacterium]